MTLWSHLQQLVHWAQVVADRKHSRRASYNNFRPPSSPSSLYPFRNVIVVWGYQDYAWKQGELYHMEIDTDGDFVQVIPFHHTAQVRLFQKKVPRASICIALHGDYYFSPLQLETLDWVLCYLEKRCHLPLNRAIIGNKFAPYDLLPIPLLELLEAHDYEIVPFGLYRKAEQKRTRFRLRKEVNRLHDLVLRLRRPKQFDASP